MTLSQIIQATQIVDTLKRKPEELQYQTFFSKHDLWRYYAVFDDRTCERCERWQTVHDITGEDLITWFPDLEIYDQNMIYANIHPNCRCYLLRIVNPNDPRNPITAKEVTKQ